MVVRKIIALCAVLILPACSLATLTPAPATATSTLSVSPTAAKTATSAPAFTLTATPAAVNTPTSPTVLTSTPSTGNTAPVITAENASSLTAVALTLPEYPQSFLWVPAGGAKLPAGFSSLTSAPDLLAQSGTNLYPIHFNPAGFGKPAALPVPGMVLAFAPDLSSVVANPDPGVNSPPAMYDLTGKLLHTLDEPAGYGASYSRDGMLLAVTSQNELAVILYDVSTGQRLNKLTGFQTAAPVYSAGIVPGNKIIYWISRATLEFQDMQTGQLGQKLSYQDFIGPFAFSPDGSRLALSVEGKLFLYSVPDARQLAVITLSQGVSSLAMSPDGKLLAGGYGPNVQIWDASNLAPIASLPGSDTSTGQVSFSPDGRYLVIGLGDNVVQVWK